MSEEQRKYYLKLKTRDERDAYLKKLGLWDTFYSYDPEEREDIVAGDVKIGWSKKKVEMAWGAPYTRKKAIGRAASRSEIYIYRFESSNRMARFWCGNQTVKQCTRLCAYSSERSSSMTMW